MRIAVLLFPLLHLLCIQCATQRCTNGPEPGIEPGADSIGATAHQHAAPQHRSLHLHCQCGDAVGGGKGTQCLAVIQHLIEQGAQLLAITVLVVRQQAGGQSALCQILKARHCLRQQVEGVRRGVGGGQGAAEIEEYGLDPVCGHGPGSLSETVMTAHHLAIALQFYDCERGWTLLTTNGVREQVPQSAASNSAPMAARTLSGTGIGRWLATSIQTIFTSP